MSDALAMRSVIPQLLEDIHPDLALFCERGYTPAGDMFDGCMLHDVDVIQWLGAPQSDRLLFKRYRMENRDTHPLALSTATWKKLQQMRWTRELEERLLTQLASYYQSGAWYNRQQLQEGKVFKSRQEIHEQLGLDPSKKTAVIFAHILYDATFFYGTSLFSDYEEWLVEAVRCAIANPNLNWIVKVHPVNVWRSRMDGVEVEQLENLAIERAVGPLPPHVTILPADTDINTFAFEEQARKEADEWMAAIPDLQELVELQVDGYRTGRNVQSYVVRRFRTGRLNSQDEAHRSETRRLLSDALAMRSVIPQLLEDIHPDLALFCERGYTPAGDMFDGCMLHDVDVIQWLGAPQSDRLLFKRYRMENRDTHPLALSTATWKKLQQMRWTRELEERLLTQLASYYQSGAWYNRPVLRRASISYWKVELSG